MITIAISQIKQIEQITRILKNDNSEVTNFFIHLKIREIH